MRTWGIKMIVTKKVEYNLKLTESEAKTVVDSINYILDIYIDTHGESHATEILTQLADELDK